MVSMIAHFASVWHIIPSLIPPGIHKLTDVSDGLCTVFREQGGTHVDNVEGLQSQLGLCPSIRLGGTHIDEIDERVSHADVGDIVVSGWPQMTLDSLTCSHWQSQSSST